ncbi:glycosyltransferase family 2 protein [Thaumasiovibrio sp. DFM-14]|uniref:glycosyltransferase family 2 protein n=1 Tax=Thaumasiovibrio sp. DFM-14 TaxID=3384792 RepID=UPI0039A102A4
MTIKFSIIIPTFNVYNEIAECIDSLYNQTFTNFEVIVVDDNSKDGTSELLNKLSLKYGFKVHYLELSLGPGNARNKGVEHAQGDYIIFVDGDDKLSPGLLSGISQLDSELIIYDFVRFWSEAEVKENKNKNILSNNESLLINTIEDKICLFDNFQVCWNKAYKREFYLREGLRFERGYYEDISFNYQAILMAKSISTLPFVGYWYRQRIGSVLNSKSNNHVDVIFQYDLVYKLFSTLDFDARGKTRRKIDKVFIEHVFNILFRQKNRFNSTTRNEIISGFLQVCRTYGVNCYFKLSIIVKYLLVRVLYIMKIFLR